MLGPDRLFTRTAQSNPQRWQAQSDEAGLRIHYY